MWFKVSVLVVGVFLLADVAVSQNSNRNNQNQPFDSDLWMPFYAAASKTFENYQNSRQAPKQLNRQWDKTGLRDMFEKGMQYAQQGIALAQKEAEAAMGQAAGMMQKEFY